MTRTLFELADGSVIGTHHRRNGENNQDASAIYQDDMLTIGIVCDGCSDSKFSESGSRIGSRLILQSLVKQLKRYYQSTIDWSTQPSPAAWSTDRRFWDRIERDTTSSLHQLAQQMGESLTEQIAMHFLFTTIGFIIAPTGGVFFSFGDGVIVVNGEVLQIGPFPGNAPPYIGYQLVNSRIGTENPELLKFQVHREIPLADLNTFMVGTDGVLDLKRSAERPLPGKSSRVRPLSQFWEEDQYFLNPDMANRLLRLANQEVHIFDPVTRALLKTEFGILPDDTTFIVGRRRKEG
ncbi:MAG: protein phosphatase 2C domain-containing protein [Candidatus Levybacteria bacterium]|nr:protein phosphatase 2C domain-containing protein [Candidatus Levybacteria bacterium]